MDYAATKTRSGLIGAQLLIRTGVHVMYGFICFFFINSVTGVQNIRIVTQIIHDVFHIEHSI